MRNNANHPGDNAPEGRDEDPMTNTSEGFAVVAPAARRGRSGRAAVLALAVVAAGLAACEGDNLYSGEGPSFNPRILEISAPETVFAGDTVSVRVDAAAARNVEQIIVTARGAANIDTVVTVDEPKQQIAQVVKIGIPALVQDSLLRITARVIDAVGAKSDERQLLVSAVGPPVVQTVSGPSGVRPGQTVNLQVRAFGTRPISRLDIAARGAINRDTTVLVTPAQSLVLQDVAFVIPATVQDTVITFSVTAQDESGQISPQRVGLVPFAIDTPSVSLVAPPTVQAGKVLNVAVAAQSLRQITQVGIEVSGGVVPTQIIPVTLNPARAATVEYFSVVLPENLVVPQLQVQAFALDKGNHRSETPPQIVTVPSNVPTILAVDPFSSAVLAGHFIDARVTAQGDRPIKEIRVRWRGFEAQTLRELEGAPDEVLEISPAQNFVSEDISVESPCIEAGGTLLMLVTVRDVDDRLSATVSRNVTLTANPACDEEPADTTTVTPRMPRTLLPGITGSDFGPLSFGSVGEPFVAVSGLRAVRRGRRRA